MSTIPHPSSAADGLRLLAEGTAAAIGDEFFRALAKYAAKALATLLPQSR